MRFPAHDLRAVQMKPAVSIVVLAVILAGCGGDTASTPSAGASQDDGGTTKTELVVGTDISDTRTLDPHRQFDTSPYLTMHAVYENLLTVEAPNYNELVPQLATSWELVDDGSAWQFELREGIRFPSGNTMTADDVKFSFDRLKNLGDTPSVVAENIESVEVIDPLTVKVTMVNPSEPLLTFLMGSGTWGILDSQVAKEHGAVSGPEAATGDAATDFLDGQSLGTGPYQLVSWDRNAEIVLEPNPNYWGEPAAFERVIIRHFSETSASQLALEQGDIDIAQNLNADQLASLEGKEGISILEVTSLDVLYWTLSENHEESGALAEKSARQAIAYAVDWDGLIDGLLDGYAVRPPTFMPIGLDGITEEYAAENRYDEDLDRARELLAEAGYPDGFSFPLSYGTSTFAGVPFESVVLKLQTDLARVGIEVIPDPMDTTTFTDLFREGGTVSGLAPWASDGPEPWLMAAAAVNRLAVRANWTPSDELLDIVAQAGAATDPDVSSELYREYEQGMIDQVAYLSPFQPIYRQAVRDTITNVNLTAAGWFFDLSQIQPAE